MKKVLIAALMALGLSGCSINPEDQALIDSVVTALKGEPSHKSLLSLRERLNLCALTRHLT